MGIICVARVLPCRKSTHIAMLKSGIPLRNTQVRVQEYRSRTTNHCAMYNAHDRHVQMMHLDEALCNQQREYEEGQVHEYTAGNRRHT